MVKRIEETTGLYLDSGVLSYDRVRENVINNTLNLSNAGYFCHWEGDLILNFIGESKHPGFYRTGKSFFQTMFGDGKMLFNLDILKKDNKASIYGNDHTRGMTPQEMKKMVKPFEDVTGIPLNLKDVSEFVSLYSGKSE